MIRTVSFQIEIHFDRVVEVLFQSLITRNQLEVITNHSGGSRTSDIPIRGEGRRSSRARS